MTSTYIPSDDEIVGHVPIGSHTDRVSRGPTRIRVARHSGDLAWIRFAQSVDGLDTESVIGPAREREREIGLGSWDLVRIVGYRTKIRRSDITVHR